MIEVLAYFISKHAALVFVSDYLVKKRWRKKMQLKWALRTLFFIVNIVLGSILFMINLSLKPMVTSLAKVQRSIGRHLDAFTFTDLNDKQIHSLADYQGKVLVLNFWATYCAPCLEEFADLKKLEEIYSDQIEVIALSDEDPGLITRRIQRLKKPSRIGYYSNEKWMNLESFRPVTIILDKEGIIREYRFGRNSLKEFSKMIIVYL